jgi:putative ABC transport system substrate-binding protein
MQRRNFIIAATAALAAPLVARWPAAAQQVRKVGWLFPGPVSVARARAARFAEGLHSAGFRTPQDVNLLVRAAEGENARIVPLARELIELNVEVVVAISSQVLHPVIRYMRSVNSTLPVLAMSTETDPVASGLAQSLANPGGHVTGLFLDFPEFSKKWLELLIETMPATTRFAVVWDPLSERIQLNAIEAAAEILNVELSTLQVRSRYELDEIFDAARRRGAAAVLLPSSPIIGSNEKLVADLALKHRLPAVTTFTDFPRVGGFMAYGPNLLDMIRHLGGMTAKVLQGRKPADLPVERPSRFELVVNLKTAKALGLRVPTSILIRADEVIE